MFAPYKLPIKYAIFSVIATVANIGAQDLVIRANIGDFELYISLVVGTGVGLVVKYVLDKHFIFRFRARNVIHDAQTFFFYTVMGLATTAIFWSFEFVFHEIFGTKEIRYLGGAIGLAIGYLTKYHLDKRYVFLMEAI
mgnify:CR=1 FL=1